MKLQFGDTKGRVVPVKDTQAMIAGMTPQLRPGTWVFCTDPNPESKPPNAFAMIREAEGTTFILPRETAQSLGYDASLGMRQITLSVFSDLEGIGLTAAVAAALTDAGISCNVVAAFHHDHVFVPEADAERAMAALLAVQAEAKQS
ncbi:MAG: ACT domain-containing protein [Tateyamaria sp.]